MKRFGLRLVMMSLGLMLTMASALAGGDLAKRGRYVVEIAGCNDCHTPGYAENGGQTPVQQWLTGNPVGFRGPWGVTFPVNLRLLMQTMNEDEWAKKAKTFVTRPPMPWFNVHYMSDTDQRALYQFIRSLGPAGDPAPAYVPPGQVTDRMSILFVPGPAGKN